MKTNELMAPPNSPEAERSVLGSCLIDRRSVEIAASILQPRHFYFPAHQRIFAAAAELFQQDQPVDILTVSQRLKDKGDGEPIGINTLAELADSVPTTANTEYYARIVLDKAVRRGMIHAAADVRNWAYDESIHLEDVLAQSERRVLNVAERRAAEIPSTSEAWQSLARKITDGDVAVPFHLTALNKATSGGMRRGWYSLVGGPSGGGKTRWLAGLIHDLLRRGRPQVLFSLEMSREDMLAILAALELQINPDCIGRTDPMDPFVVGPGSEDWDAVGEIVLGTWDRLLYVVDTSGMSVDDMGAMVRRIQRKVGDVDVHIDFAGLVSGRGSETLQRLETVAAELAQMYKSLGVRGVVLTQITMENGRAHARYGRDLEFYAQCAYYIELPDTGSLGDLDGEVQFRNAKNRLGRRTGHVLTIHWNADLATFED